MRLRSERRHMEGKGCECIASRAYKRESVCMRGVGMRVRTREALNARIQPLKTAEEIKKYNSIKKNKKEQNKEAPN